MSGLLSKMGQRLYFIVCLIVIGLSAYDSRCSRADFAAVVCMPDMRSRHG